MSPALARARVPTGRLQANPAPIAARPNGWVTLSGVSLPGRGIVGAAGNAPSEGPQGPCAVQTWARGCRSRAGSPPGQSLTFIFGNLF